MIHRKLTLGKTASSVKPMLALSACLTLAAVSYAQDTHPTQETRTQLPNAVVDPTAALRRFPISITVRRPDIGDEPVSILRLVALHPHDDVIFSIDDRLKGDWTLVSAVVGAGGKIHVKAWNLWEKRLQGKPIDTGEIPDNDIVPLYFLVLNKGKERRVFDGVQHALETSAQQIISQTAVFQDKYQQQNRLLNFMTAYAMLGPKTCPDPVSLQNRVDAINLDLGATYDPTQEYSAPAQLQHGLDAGVGVINAYRESPDNPVPLAAAARSNLPGIVSDWVSLVGDLMSIFIRPPKDVKLTFIPASAEQLQGLPPTTGEEADQDAWLQLVTQRVLETADGSLPALVYKPQFERPIVSKPFDLTFATPEVLAGTKEVAIPLGKECLELYQHDWAWGWESSVDGKPYYKLDGAHLVPGRGLVFPIPPDWWGNATEHKVIIRARIGFRVEETKPIRIARTMPQHWAVDSASTLDIASGDPSVSVNLDRSGIAQPYYLIGSVFLKDSAGKTYSAENFNYDGKLTAHFNLSQVAPGPAQLGVEQLGADAPDQPTTIFVAPKHPSISIFCGKGDRVLRISGPEATWVKSVEAPHLTVQGTDDSEAGNRKLTLSAALPDTTRSVDVTYRDPQHGLEWTRPEPVSVGLPRPRVTATVVGVLPSTVSVGSGADPSWVEATMPAGWVRSHQPLRIQLGATRPFSWTHDVALELGFGSSGDVQSVLNVPEGSMFAFDGSSPDAYLTLDTEANLPVGVKRSTGLMWLQLSRSDLSSPWTLVNVKTDSGEAPLRVVKLPVVQSVQSTATGTLITLSNADQVLGAKFAGQPTFTPPTLLDSSPGNLMATISGPPNVTEFDLELRDADDGVLHIKIVKKP